MEKDKLNEGELEAFAELEALFPQPVPFPIGTKIVLQLLPMDLARCAAFAQKARPLIKAVFERSGDVPDLSVGALLPHILIAVSDYGDDFIQAMAIAIGKSPAFAARIPPAIASALLTKVFAVNAEFFAQSVALLASGAKTMTPESARIESGPMP